MLWTRKTDSGKAMKRFDDTHFKRWVRHCGFDFDSRKRIDHDRADSSRTQYRCVFRWGKSGQQSVEIADKEVTLGSQKVPVAFIELDEEGLARVKVGDVEDIYNVVEMRHDGAALLIKTAGGEKKKLDGKKLSR
jgi:hypothetical protein